MNNDIKFGILGSGFGLYGYLPSVLLNGISRVIISKKSKTKFMSRGELKKFTPKILWAKDDDDILKNCDVLAIVKPPKQQVKWVKKAIQINKRIKFLFLEKPIAQNPHAALQIFNLLSKWNGNWNVAYLFRLFPWASKFLSECKKQNNIWIRWNFMAHHFSQNLYNWKRSHRHGGGPLRFYGIHLIALLADAGYITAKTSKLNEASWQATFTGFNLPNVSIKINSRTKRNSFVVSTSGKKVINNKLAKSPFEVKKRKTRLDFRVPFLRKYIKSPDTKNKNYTKTRNTLLLWKNIEKMTTYEKN